jgi:hypothetical protein
VAGPARPGALYCLAFDHIEAVGEMIMRFLKLNEGFLFLLFFSITTAVFLFFFVSIIMGKFIAANCKRRR